MLMKWSYLMQNGFQSPPTRTSIERTIWQGVIQYLCGNNFVLFDHLSTYLHVEIFHPECGQ